MAEEAPPLPPPSQPPPPEEPVATAFASAPSRPAAFLVQNALRPECSVDFPQITEICERLEMQPSELRAAVAVLAAALREQRHPLRVKLKALTIANEMLYNPRAVQELGAAEGLREALEVLRQVRGGELGPAMDENVRMLATEIEVKCFHERLPPSNGHGWTSFTKAMSSDFEKARKMAKKNLQQFSQKAEKHMEKAERVFEKGATKFMQEAENMLTGTSSREDGSSLKGQKPLLTQEEEELQWALRASLEEAQRSRKHESQSRAQRHSKASRGRQEAETERKQVNIEDLPQKLSEAQGRAKAAEELLNRQLAVQAKKSKERSELEAKNQELSSVAERLAEELFEAEAGLAKLKQRRQALEEQLAIALSMEVDEPRLRQRLQSLEAQVEQAKSKDAAAEVSEAQVSQVSQAPQEVPKNAELSPEKQSDELTEASNPVMAEEQQPSEAASPAIEVKEVLAEESQVSQVAQEVPSSALSPEKQSDELTEASNPVMAEEQQPSEAASPAIEVKEVLAEESQVSQVAQEEVPSGAFSPEKQQSDESEAVSDPMTAEEQPRPEADSPAIEVDDALGEVSQLSEVGQEVQSDEFPAEKRQSDEPQAASHPVTAEEQQPPVAASPAIEAEAKIDSSAA